MDWDEIFSEEGIEWGEIERFHVIRDDEAWTVYAETDDGEVSEVAYLDDEEMEEFFWDDLWYWAMENEVDVDREVAYASE